MKFFWMSITLLVALIIPAQAAMNAKMRTFVLNPMYSTFVSFGIGMLSALVAVGISRCFGQEGDWRAVWQAPWWAWCGGIVGMVFVTLAILAVPRIGAASFSAIAIAGQLIGALVLDHFGLLGLEQNSINASRFGGALLLLAGVWLMLRD
jgi:transporter family-2 protein